MKKVVLISAAAALIALTGCSQQANGTDKVSNKTVEITGIRKTDLNAGSENLPVVEYHAPAPIPGKVKTFKKSFVTAPPMIPHSVEGMLPITKDKNMCLNCHMPENAKALGVTPMPEDHFIDNFEGGKKIKRVAGSRWFCTTCHTPQANIPVAVENKFESLKSKAGIQ